MTDSYLKLRCLSVPESETARFALRAEKFASQKKKRARAPNPLSCRKPQKARNPHSEAGGDKKRRKRRRKAKE